MCFLCGFSVSNKFCVSLCVYVFVCNAWNGHPQNGLHCVGWTLNPIHSLTRVMTSCWQSSCTAQRCINIVIFIDGTSATTAAVAAAAAMWCWREWWWWQTHHIHWSMASKFQTDTNTVAISQLVTALHFVPKKDPRLTLAVVTGRRIIGF